MFIEYGNPALELFLAENFEEVVAQDMTWQLDVVSSRLFTIELLAVGKRVETSFVIHKIIYSIFISWGQRLFDFTSEHGTKFRSMPA